MIFLFVFAFFENAKNKHKLNCYAYKQLTSFTNEKIKKPASCRFFYAMI